MKRRIEKGFTLMEMLIVVAIIGILVAVAIPVFSGSLESVREAVCTANRRSLLSQLTIQKMLTEAKTLEAVANTEEGKAWVADAVCPSKGIVEVYDNDITCTKHGGTLSERNLLQQFQDQHALMPANRQDNSSTRKALYNELYPNGWPAIKLNGQKLYVQPYYDGKTKAYVLFANKNKESTDNWNADAIYDFDTGTWYAAPNSSSYVGLVGNDWTKLQALMADKKWVSAS